MKSLGAMHSDICVVVITDATNFLNAFPEMVNIPLTFSLHWLTVLSLDISLV